MAEQWQSADLEVGLVRAAAGEEQTKLGTSRPSRGWKIGLALLAIGLCAAAAAGVFISIHNQKRDISEGSEDVSYTLRQISKRHHNGNQQVAIHVEGEINDLKNKLEWSDSIEQAFSHGGLELKDNEIIIPKKGLYYVYSQASFRINCQVNSEAPDQEGETIYLQHVVKRKTDLYDGERPLLQAMRSSCKRVLSEEKWYGAINLGAVFSLEQGDRLSTETLPLENVDEDSGKTFFGVFAL